MQTIISQIALDQYVDLFNAVNDGLSKRADFNDEIDALVKEAFNPFSWIKNVAGELWRKGITPTSRHMYKKKLEEGRRVWGKFFNTPEEAEKALEGMPSHMRGRELRRLAEQDIDEALQQKVRKTQGKTAPAPAQSQMAAQPAPVQPAPAQPQVLQQVSTPTSTPITEADVKLLEQAAQGEGGWNINPWLAGAIGAAGVGIPLSFLAAAKIRREAEDRARRAALIAGGAGFGTGVLAGRIIPRVGEKMMNVAERLQNWNNPYYWQQQAMQQYPVYYW